MSPERYFSPESFPSAETTDRKANQNEFAIADHELRRVEQLLKEAGATFKTQLLRQPEALTKDSGVPGYYEVKLFDPENPSKPASAEYTKQIIDLLIKAEVGFGDIEQLK